MQTENRRNKEKWKPVVGWEGQYEVSNLGRIRSMDKSWKLGESTIQVVGRIKAIVSRPDGYMSITLGRGKTYLIHRLVAQTFLPNPHNHPTVNHKDWNKKNNKVSNLEWCTRKHNSQHAYSNPVIRASAKSKLKLDGAYKSALLRCCGINVFKNGVFIKYYERMADLKKGLGIKHDSNVYNVMSGSAKQHLGYTFEKVIKPSQSAAKIS